ncbi:MAG: nucleotidyltransferase family protein [Deltaproteobacteria bacterium]|nr:nucleotidyltransferase family protein [Deltaproteobacteria bacterium]
MFEEILAALSKALQGRSIPYMVIGGQAILLYGEPRLTRDIDITLGVDADRLDDVLALARELSLRVLPDNVRDFVLQTMVLPCLHEESGIRVDFIFSFTPYEAQAIKRANRVQILGTEVCFASPEDMIIHKIFAGRPRDREDVRSILLRNDDLDIPYIRSWLDEFDESSEEKGFRKSFEELLGQI